MRLLPREIDGLLTHHVGFLSQKRLARGLRLNYPETVALIASQVVEMARDGENVARLMDLGQQLLGRRQVMDGVAEMIEEVQVEATFIDGTKLITINSPINLENGDLKLALHGSFLPIPDLSLFDKYDQSLDKKEQDSFNNIVQKDFSPPGDIFLSSSGPIALNQGRRTITISVTSTCNRPVQVGSHYHFIETNKALIFDREAAYGMRLNIPAGTAIRFEPGETRSVQLVEISGNRKVFGGNGLCDGTINNTNLTLAMEKIRTKGFGHKHEEEVPEGSPYLMKRFLYARSYGPTVGDRIRLGDTSLIIEVEKDFCVYGDECKFGGGKVIREGQGQQSQVSCHQALDTLITNALIVDAILGIVKADVGIKGNQIMGIGKSGNPDVMEGVDPNLVVGAGTEVIAGENLILTAGALDSHVHFICPQLATEAIASGITTMFGGGTGPASGTCATTCSPGPNHIKYMIQSTDAYPLNFGFTGKGNTSQSSGLSLELIEQIEAGAIGLKLHEDWGTTPASIDCALRVADEYDVQIMIHTDTLNESGCVEETVEAIAGRTIHTYHTEGAGGGHAPDILKICGEPNDLPSSTNPTRPYTYNTVQEHLDMLMVCHHLDKNLKEDVAFAESRIRAETIAAEDILHDIGAISMISSDAQAMGRIGEVITRTWQTADKMKKVRGQLPEAKGAENDNYRVLRYVAKYTVNVALSNGMADLIGSIQPGKMADLVLWKPAFFGVKPEMVIKGGQIAWSKMGMANASVPTTQPLKMRKMFGAYGKCVGNNSVVFVSQLSVDKKTVESYGISKGIVPVTGCRNISKKDMILNDSCPNLRIDPETYRVTIEDVQEDGQKEETHLTCPPAKSLPLAQRYFIF